MGNKIVMCIGGNKMKKLFFGILLLALAIVVPIPTMAGVNIGIGISLPPPIVFEAPPDVIVLPDTNDVYVVPDVDVDIFFYNGWWWRPWEGRWYRSRYYNRGWGYYNNVPSFYFDVDPGWRGYYRDRNWYGHRWNYERIPDRRLQQNWKGWHNNRHWERQGTWGVQSYQPRPQQQRQELRQQRQQQYQQMPEVQKQRQPQVQKPQGQQQRQPQVQQPKQQPKEKVQRQQRQPQVQRPRQQPQEKVQQVKPAERVKPTAPEGGPTGRGQKQQVKPAEKKPAESTQKDQKKQETEPKQ
jgi:hypothetical protein